MWRRRFLHVLCALLWHSEENVCTIESVIVSTCLMFVRFTLSRQSFNAPPRSKMKLWKGATFAFMLCGAALSILLVRNMATIGQLKSKTKYLYTSSASSKRSSSSESASKASLPSPSSTAAEESTVLSWQMGGHHRRTRSADDMNSLLSECKINCYCLFFLVWSEIRCCVKGQLELRLNTWLLFTEQAVLSVFN